MPLYRRLFLINNQQDSSPMVYFMCPEQIEVTVSSTLTLGLLNTYSTVKKLGKAADVPYMSVWGACTQ